MKKFLYTKSPTGALAMRVVCMTLCQYASAAELVHRYSFGGDATDSVGTAQGTLLANGTIDGDKLTTSGTDGLTSGVSLPPAAVAGITGGFSIEVSGSYNGTSKYPTLSAVLKRIGCGCSR